jgi:hypothetical protein
VHVKKIYNLGYNTKSIYIKTFLQEGINKWWLVVVRFFISISVPYFTILHTIIIIVHLHGIFNIVFYNFHLLLMQHGPLFFLKVGVQICSPKIKIKIIEYP